MVQNPEDPWQSNETSKRPSLNKHYKTKRIKWVHRYLKMNFKNVIFTVECHARIIGPDSLSSVWILKGHQPRSQIHQQQGGIMFWAEIKTNVIIGPYKVKQQVRFNLEAYYELFSNCLVPWLQDLSSWKATIFQHDNDLHIDLSTPLTASKILVLKVRGDHQKKSLQAWKTFGGLFGSHLTLTSSVYWYLTRILGNTGCHIST